MKIKCRLTIMFFSFPSQFYYVDTPLAFVSVSLSCCVFSSGWTYPGKRRSFGLTGVTLMNSAFSREVPVYLFSRRSWGAVMTVV